MKEPNLRRLAYATMQSMRRTVLVLLTLSMAAVSALGSDDWTGLWRVKRVLGDDLDGVMHFYFSNAEKDRLTLYGDLYRTMTIRQLEISGDTLDVIYTQSIKHPLPVQIKVKRKDGRLEGEWSFSHFQMTTPITGRAGGDRIHTLGAWDPWQALHENRDGRLIDINGFLLKSAPTGSFEKFLSYWNGIEPAYYFFVEDWLYGRQPDESTPREERLKALFETLKRSRAEKRLIVDFPGLVTAAVNNSEKMLGLPSKAYFVSSFASQPVVETTRWSRIPEPGELEGCNCQILDLSERFVSINPALFASYGEEGPLRLRRAVIHGSLWEEGSVSREVDLLRQGLALRLALQAEGKDIPVLPAAKLKLLVERLQSAAVLKPSGVSETPVHGPDASLEDTVGSQFVAALLESRSAAEVAAMKSGEVTDEWRRYADLITRPDPN